MDATKPKSRLLLVDDEAEIREIVAMHLGAPDIETVEAADGEAALAILRSQPIDLVLSDLMMPRMTGLTLLANMRDAGFLQPFIFLTAYPSQETTVQALRLGAFDYLEKPFIGHELRTLVTEALRVSHEMTRLGLSRLKANDDAPSQLPVPAQRIAKLRTLRSDDTMSMADDEEPLPTQMSPSPQINEFFSGEATAQLLFCQDSIGKLNDPDECVQELSYLFRVMQGIADAAKAIAADEIADLARAAEYFYTALRIHPQFLTVDLVKLAYVSNGQLQKAVAGLAEPGSTTVDLSSETAAMHQACALLSAAS